MSARNDDFRGEANGSHIQPAVQNVLCMNLDLGQGEENFFHLANLGENFIARGRKCRAGT